MGLPSRIRRMTWRLLTVVLLSLIFVSSVNHAIPTVNNTQCRWVYIEGMDFMTDTSCISFRRNNTEEAARFECLNDGGIAFRTFSGSSCASPFAKDYFDEQDLNVTFGWNVLHNCGSIRESRAQLCSVRLRIYAPQNNTEWQQSCKGYDYDTIEYEDWPLVTKVCLDRSLSGQDFSFKWRCYTGFDRDRVTRQQAYTDDCEDAEFAERNDFDFQGCVNGQFYDVYETDDAFCRGSAYYNHPDRELYAIGVLAAFYLLCGLSCFCVWQLQKNRQISKERKMLDMQIESKKRTRVHPREQEPDYEGSPRMQHYNSRDNIHTNKKYEVDYVSEDEDEGGNGWENFKW